MKIIFKKDATLNAILQIHFEQPDGGILAFLTGQVNTISKLNYSSHN